MNREPIGCTANAHRAQRQKIIGAQSAAMAKQARAPMRGPSDIQSR
jgi:hypothetical protein